MPVRPISEWSETESDNQFPAADGGCANNWVGADVNDAARARMSAVASWFQSQEFSKLLYAASPWGSLGTLTRIDATTFDTNKLVGALFPAGRRLILYVAGTPTEEVFVVSATEGVPAAGWTRIVVNGTVPVGIDDIGFANMEQLPGAITGEYGNPEYGMGTTAQRNAAAAKEGLLWFNTDDHKVEIYYGAAWRTLAVVPTASGSLTRSGWDSANGTQDFVLDIAAPTAQNPLLNFAINSVLRGVLKGTTTHLSLQGGPSAGSLSELIIGDNVLTFDGNELRPGYVDAATVTGLTPAQLADHSRMSRLANPAPSGPTPYFVIQPNSYTVTDTSTNPLALDTSGAGTGVGDFFANICLTQSGAHGAYNNVYLDFFLGTNGDPALDGPAIYTVGPFSFAVSANNIYTARFFASFTDGDILTVQFRATTGQTLLYHNAVSHLLTPPSEETSGVTGCELKLLHVYDVTSQ